jgi:AcrR family transcriptional regulator
MNAISRPQNRKEQILVEATRLFARHGYKATSIRGIAEACGISEAALYRHFTGKDDIYAGVIEYKAGQHDIAGFLHRAERTETVYGLLERMAGHMLSFLDTDPELIGLMFNNSVESGPAAAILFKKIRLPYIEYLAGELQRRMKVGEVREVDPYITSRCFVGMVMDCALTVGVWNKITHFDFHARKVIRNNVPIFARGLLNDTGVRQTER